MSSTDWQETVYEQNYSSTLTSLRRRRTEDPLFSAGAARAILGHLYIQDGNDQGGRGELQDLYLRATIDAHEAFIAELEREQQ